MKTQIPVYRAKRKDNGEWVEGYFCLVPSTGKPAIQSTCKTPMYMYPIDTRTLAIHFPDMIDKNGDRIFAALNESGVGGSISKEQYSNDDSFEEYVAVQHKGKIAFSMLRKLESGVFFYTEFPLPSFILEVTGIYEGETK